MNRLPIDPTVQLVETPEGEVTLKINEGLSMQGWERELMQESGEILCSFGSQFLEVGLGLGFSALHIAQHQHTRKHTVVEIYRPVIDLFKNRHPLTPSTLEIVNTDFFKLVSDLEPETLDGIFFDPALPDSLWNDGSFWDELMPRIVRSLRPGGAFIPFFSTIPVLRWQYVNFFPRVIVERRPYKAYATTTYISCTSGDAYIQCFVKGSF